MPDELSVRQWQELYRAGAFNSKDAAVQLEAGWWNWHCHDHALLGRLKMIAPVVMGIKTPFILDRYSLGFSNERFNRKMSYDRIHFAPMDESCDGNRFIVDHDRPYGPERWMVYTARFGLEAPEYGCKYVREMVQYITGMAHDLEASVRPPFLDEQAAAVGYMQSCRVPCLANAMRREGEHSYSFLDWNDGRRKTVHVTRSLEDVPPDLQVSRTLAVNGFYVYCPEDGGIPPPDLVSQAQRQRPKGKEEER